MLWVPQKGIVRATSNTGAVGAGAVGTAVTTGATASAKGTAVELIASTPFDSHWIRIVASDYASPGVASEGSLDILTGAAAEDILIPDLLMGYCGLVIGGGKGVKQWDFPLHIPAGTRLAAQAAGARVSTAMRVAIWLYGGDSMPKGRVGTRVTTYGMGTVPNGTSITPGATGAEGAWTEVSASSSRDHFAFVPSFQPSADISISNRAYQVDIGVGAATEEQIGDGFWYIAEANEAMEGALNSYPVFQDVPSGTRLVMRVSNNSTNETAYNVVLHAVT